MKLNEAITLLEGARVIGESGVDIAEIAYHTERVVPGSCFVAIRGTASDGHAFVEEAIRRGAHMVVTERPVVELPFGVTNVVVRDTRDALARLSAAHFINPSLAMKLVGVTGTSGKTTITYLLEEIFRAAGWSPGVIGTVEYRYAGARHAASHTTPESYELQKLLRAMVDRGVTSCAMEVSSHALDMERVVACHFDGAIFTNLTPEHLDYHSTMEAYYTSKARLFLERLVASVKEKTFAVVNTDDAYGRRLAACVTVPLVSYGLTSGALVTSTMFTCDAQGLAMMVRTPRGEVKIRSELVGRFNALNILAAVAAGMALDIELETIAQAVARVTRIPGRVDRVPNDKGVLAFVDYAHKPDALVNMLSCAKELAKGRLIVVFGCGGDRDRAKRPLMGEAVARFADIAVVTSDNPRTEDPQSIIEMILPGLEKGGMCRGANAHGAYYEVIADRRAAITRAAELSRAGDVLVVAGKGHEDYQIVGKERRHFDDREVLKEVL